MSQTKKGDKTPEEELSEVKIANLTKKELRVAIIKMVKELGRRMDAQCKKLEVFNKKLENIKNNQTEMKNTVTEIKNTRRGLPWWRSGWEPACQCKRHGFEPWFGKIPHAAEQLSP